MVALPEPQGTCGESVVEGEARDRVDVALRAWRQGDCVLGEHWFLYRIDAEQPLTAEAAVAAEEGGDAAEAVVHGLMIATQTCDLVRKCGNRPFLEVCPLVEVDSQVLDEIRLGRRPGYAYLPGLAEHMLVADLDRVMSVEKPVVAKWIRTRGCLCDTDARRLSQALARKRARAAFPDDFVTLVGGLVGRLKSHHKKQSPEGVALRSLREIRVRAEPDWDAQEVRITFWFVPDERMEPSVGPEWASLLDSWLGLLTRTDRFTEIEGLVQTLDDLSAREYVESDPLDLDHLSSGQ